MLSLITGASSGFGKATAKKFTQEGYKVILLARRIKILEALKEELGDNCVQIIGCDINDKDSIRSKLSPFVSQIDILINNAGLALGMEHAQECDIKDWEQMIQTNILSLINITHLILPYMVEKKHGHIINIGSIAGSYPYPGGNVYGATKAFLKQFSLNLRADLYDKNIRVSNIEPGLAQSEFSLVRFKGDINKAQEPYLNTKPLTPEDIAQTIFWVATMPEHVNINRIELMPTTQAPAALNVYRNPLKSLE